MKILKDFFRENYYLLSGLLMFLSWPSFEAWPFRGFPFFAWIFPVPLFMYCFGKSAEKVFSAAFLTGIAGHLLTINWIGNFAGDQPGGAAVILGFLIPALSVFFALKLFLAEFISARFPKLRLPAYALSWCFVDWVQSLGYLAFPWLNIAYSQYPVHTMLQTSSVFGAAGLGFFMVMTSAVLAEALVLRREQKIPFRRMFSAGLLKKPAVMAVLIVLFHVYGAAVIFSAPEPSCCSLRVAGVQTCIDPWEGWEINSMRYLADQKLQSEKILDVNPDLLVWSESSALEPVTYSFKQQAANPFVRDLLSFVKEKQVPLFTGEIGVKRVKADNRIRHLPENSAVLISKDGEPADQYSKINLVPFGEWFPYSKVPLIGKSIGKLAVSLGGSVFYPGEKLHGMQLGEYSFGPLICYEGIFPRFCREYKRQGVDFFINITNDGWSHAWSGHMQHFAASVFRAAENGLWMVRVGNTGYSAVIDPYGRVRASMPILEKGAFSGDMDFSLNHETFYAAAGGWIQAVLIFLFLGMVLSALISKFKKRTV